MLHALAVRMYLSLKGIAKPLPNRIALANVLSTASTGNSQPFGVTILL
jgi:hypothetical protein